MVAGLEVNISAFELKLDFAEDTRLRTYANLISEALGESESEEESEPVLVHREKEKLAIRWGYDWCGLVKEAVGNSTACITNALEIIRQINKAAPIRKLSCRTLRVDWIFPASPKNDFKHLEMKYRHIFIAGNGLFSKSYDSSAMVDMKYGNIILHHQSGAMKLLQLQDDFRYFPVREGHPQLFLFLNTQATDSRKIRYSEDNTRTFVQNSFELCKAHAEEFRRLVEVIL